MAMATSSGSLFSWPACARSQGTLFRKADCQPACVASSWPVAVRSVSASNVDRYLGRSVGYLGTAHFLAFGCTKSCWAYKPGSGRLRGRTLVVQAKMFVPGFGEKSPEAKAADSLHNFFTFTALKIVLSQLQSYNKDAYKDLMEFAQRIPLKDGDEFLHQLMRESPQHKTLAMRILEVRSAYANEDFEWDNVQKLSKKQMEESNTRVLREFLQQSSGMK